MLQVVPDEAPYGGAHTGKYNILTIWGFLHGQGGLKLNEHQKLKHKTPCVVAFLLQPATTTLRNHLPRKPNVGKKKIKSSFFFILCFKKRNQGVPAALFPLQCSLLAFIDATGFPISTFKVNQSRGRKKKKPFFPDSALSGIFYRNHVLKPLLD